MRQLTSAVTFCAIALAIAGGCGKGSGVVEVKVTGSVTQGSKRQAGVNVGFIPADAQAPSRGTRTDSDGKFELTMQPGKYTVVLTKMVDRKGRVPKDSEDPKEDYAQLEASGELRQVMPAKYTSKETSPFKGIDIPAEGKELPPFEVK